ncbi:ATP-binding cassette domain-containing protein [Seongchinamella sediminis]|uniref:ATP-binding cassette domain-containing protein n=1 Tax=Seongchinamella sediminis TaxID=2283635 RepID=A0A3L7DWI3_9GAMM|nr:ATP-binding cassette domain-containing protein [Seongchinamella sediminis]RLQ21135.1 ATP-binding cassette domain-containing protein [Seongchinamella sediminis]
MNDTRLFTLHDAHLVYRALPALAHINWEVHRGEQWACLGPNGAGKTSLASILSGQANHYGGDYWRSALLRERGVAYVCFEQARALCERDRKLDDSETRADASDPGTLVRQLLLDGRQADAAFDSWVQRLTIGHILDRGLRYISTGEMRKTLLARALLSNPALLILDSPLDGLDAASQQELATIIDELTGSQQTLLLLCRQAQDIPARISHLLLLDRGEIVASGLRDEVLALETTGELMNPPITPLGPLPPPARRDDQLPAAGPLLLLEQVAVRYGELQVLKGVDWRFDRGQHCYISGPNGCGKSTLLSLITGDNHKAYGQAITLFGIRRGSGESIWDIKRKYGQLDNQLHLNFARGMKALEVVLSGFFDSIGLYDDWGDSQRAIAEQWLAALGLAGIARDSFDGLSFGLQRMVLLARAMVKSPVILLLDEPTLGLDGHHRQLLLRAIDHIASHSDTQVIFVSHSAGDVPACINQHLRFIASESGFDLVCENC